MPSKVIRVVDMETGKEIPVEEYLRNAKRKYPLKKINLPSQVLQAIGDFKKNRHLFFEETIQKAISYLQNISLHGEREERKEAEKILRNLLPKSKARQSIYLRPDILLDTIDRYKAKIKLPHKSYKGQPRDAKEKDVKQIYQHITGEPYPKGATLEERSKATIAISFFSAKHILRYKEVQKVYDYWNKLRREAKNVTQGKSSSLKLEEIEKYYQMLRIAPKITLIIPFP